MHEMTFFVLVFARFFYSTIIYRNFIVYGYISKCVVYAFLSYLYILRWTGQNKHLTDVRYHTLLFLDNICMLVTINTKPLTVQLPETALNKSIAKVKRRNACLYIWHFLCFHVFLSFRGENSIWWNVTWFAFTFVFLSK